jgi:UDPglucose 6-dehydrogenase
MQISVIGLGKLGCPLAAVFADKGFTVVGTDLDGRLVDAINEGRAPVDEPRLQDLIAASRGRLRATHDCTEAVMATDLTFVIVPTPSDETGRFSNEFVLQAMDTVGRTLRHKNGYHLVVITSTVMPGSTGGEIREALERQSGRRLGPHLGLCYNPEFVALGSVVRDMLRPDMILIGESDEKAGEVLAAVYRRSCDNEPMIHRMNFVNAELTKIAVNTFVTTKISYANMLADICDRLPGADVEAVTQAIGSDSRIGTRYLKGAVGYGGPCFPRDNVAFASLARGLGARAELAEATDTLNRHQVDRVTRHITGRVVPGATVGVLGLSYKPDTGVVEQSQGVALVERLMAQGFHVVAYDPKAIAAAQKALLQPFEAAASAEECIRASSLVVVMTAWEEFRSLAPAAFARAAERVTVLDCWRIIPPDVAAVADIVYMGHGNLLGASLPA